MKTLNLIIGLFLFTAVLFAQDQNAIYKAFTESHTYESSGEYTKGVESLKKVYTEDSYEINLRLGWLTYMSGLFTESAAYYKKAIILMPYSIEAKLGLVYPVSALGNWDQVMSQYLEILKIDPSHSTVNYRVGLIYYGKEEFESAYKYFEKVVNQYPFSYDSLIMLAWCNFKLGKLREAKILFNKALLLSPEDASALEGLGLIK